MSKVYYIGIASTFHDPAITILDENGQVLFAEATERMLQNKRAMGCPADSLLWSQKLIEEFCNPDAEFHIARSWSKQYLKMLDRLLFLGRISKDPLSSLNKFLYSKVIKVQLLDYNFLWMMQKMSAGNIQAGITFERNLRVNLGVKKIYNHYFNHHECHAASGAYASSFDEGLCLVVDGMGEKGSISYFSFENNVIRQLGSHYGLESLGFFYVFLTYLCDFDPMAGEEWKVMGLSSYGKLNEHYYSLLNSIIFIDGTQIRFKSSPEKIKAIFDFFKEDLKNSGGSAEKRADLAFTGQMLFSEYFLEIIKNIGDKSQSKNLILSGGCALNSSFNGKIIINTKFEKLFVPSAPADDGASLGAAYLALHKINPGPKPRTTVLSPYLGSTISDNEVLKFLTYSKYNKIKHCPGSVCEETALLLSEGKLVGWVQGRAEFGPRSLGNRSILADPRSAEMKDTINSRVKFREEFRPFAPSILEEYGEQYFKNFQTSPYMERTLEFREEVKENVPAVVHVDGTGRLQTVNRQLNEKFYELLTRFNQITGVPVLLNTSFNVMGKPIIDSFNDALGVFFNSGLDVLVINDYIIYK